LLETLVIAGDLSRLETNSDHLILLPFPLVLISQGLYGKYLCKPVLSYSTSAKEVIGQCDGLHIK